MKKYLAHILFIAVFGGVFLVGSGSASARTATWDGEGVDNNWSTAANWDTDVAPVDGDDLVFTLATFSDGDAMNNDIVDLEVNSVVVSGDNSAGNFFVVSTAGNAVDAASLTDSSATQNWRIDILTNLVLSSDYTTPTDGFSSVASLQLRSYTLTVSSGYYISPSSISGTGSVVVDGGGLTLAAPDTPNSNFTGAVDASGIGGSVTIYGQDALPSASSVTVADGNALYLARDDENPYTVPFTLSGEGIDYSGTTGAKISTAEGFGYGDGGTPTAEGMVTIANLTLTSDVSFRGTTNLTIENITGDFTVTQHAGNVGALTLPGGGTVEAETTVTTIDAGDEDSDQFLFVGAKALTIVNGVRGDVYISSDGILAGSGAVGRIDVAGGRIEPGQSPGCLTSDGVTWVDGNPTGTLQIEAQGLTVCTEYDQFIVSEAATEVNIAGLTLELTHLGDFTTTADDQFVIIRNLSSEAITGTFVGLAEGATFVADGMTYRINYNAGEGDNDVVLTRIVAPGEPDSGLGPIANINYVWMLALGAVFMTGSGLALAKRK